MNGRIIYDPRLAFFHPFPWKDEGYIYSTRVCFTHCTVRKSSISVYIKVTAFYTTCVRQRSRAVSVVVHSDPRLPEEKNCTWWWNAARMKNSFMSFSWRLEVLKNPYRTCCHDFIPFFKAYIDFFFSLFWMGTWHKIVVSAAWTIHVGKWKKKHILRHISRLWNGLYWVVCAVQCAPTV